MAKQSKTFVDRVDFSKKKTAGDVMELFIKVARSYPNQTSALFNKYVAFLKSVNPTWTDEKSREMAKDNIWVMAGHYDEKDSYLLFETYKELRQH
ncbi:MAG: hypothetical protein J5611_01285 [Alphaproteobacteria bacterium]|nr:hypothetical protein [Alphaproteobacteria bacterium]